MDLLDETTRRVIGVDAVLAALRPNSEYGRALSARPTTFRSEHHAAWSAEQATLQEVDAWWDEERATPVREALGHLPTMDRPLAVLDSGEALDDAALFEVKRFLYWAGVLTRSSDALSLVEGAWAAQLSGLMQRLHPESKPSPRFRLSDKLDARLAASRRQLKDARNAERASRTVLEQQLLDVHGGHFDIHGLFVAPAGEFEDQRLIPRGAGRFAIVDVDLAALVTMVEEAQEHCSAIEQSVRIELTDMLRPHTGWLGTLRHALGLLDVYCARVDLRREWEGCWPSWGEELAVQAARHPRLLARSGDVQPIDVTLSAQPTIVTGPNMGGKSMLLEVLGLAQWLAQHGLPVPATSCTFRPVESIVYVGSEESSGREAGLSSFGREVRRVVEASTSAPPILWLLDEFGRGTHPEEGARIASDFISHRAEAGDVVVAATHFPAVAELEDAAHLQIAGISHPEALDALGSNPSVVEVEAALRAAMDYRPLKRSADDQDVPRDARLVARALGLDLGPKGAG